MLDAQQSEKEQAMLKRASLIAKSMTGFMTIALLVLWPMPMYGSGYGMCLRSFFLLLGSLLEYQDRTPERSTRETCLLSERLLGNGSAKSESRTVFSKKFFTGWVVVGILWLFCSAFVSFGAPIPTGLTLI